MAGITMIPASTWTIYYRAYKTGTLTVVHCDVDILVRQADETVRTTIASDVANSTNMANSWTTPLGTYAWGNYTVVDQTDFLEVDVYADVTSSESGRNAYLRIDGSGLPLSAQSRISDIVLPSEFTAGLELTGSSNMEDWQGLFWTLDNSFTAGIVNVTSQLYDFSVGQYPTSGDGYMSYVSSATPNTDKRQSQSVFTSPTRFRDASSEWKLRIAAVKKADSPFDLKIDMAELTTNMQNSNRLDATGEFLLDLSTFPLTSVQSIEIQTLYRASDSLENWFLEAYNWTKSDYDDAGFNSTVGNQPTSIFDYYSVNLTDAWQSYVQTNGTMRVKLLDQGLDDNRTTVDIDFLGVRIVLDGTKLLLHNDGPITVRIVAIWVVNDTSHTRYGAGFFLNSGENSTYIRADIRLTPNNYLVKAVTERGNVAVFEED
jgi:hypothetical protein